MKHILLALFLFASCAWLNAQTPYVINQNTNKSSGGDNNGMGSSFLTTAAGKLDSIEVYMRNGTNSTGTLYVYEGNTTASVSQIYTQVLTGIPVNDGVHGLDPYMIKLVTPVALDAASTYTFMFYNAPLRFGNSDTYADGALWTGAGSWASEGEHTNMDLDFIAYIGDPIATGVMSSNNKDITYSITDNIISIKNFAAEEILIYDLLGKTLASGKGEKLEINPSYMEGIYILSVRKGSELRTARIYLK